MTDISDDQPEVASQVNVNKWVIVLLALTLAIFILGNRHLRKEMEARITALEQASELSHD